ncbi:hypothetical protein BDR06DRAFT_976687 [Suillus hirtellus]|nr:hypothetical protein BDR06DRAFT_976687 [Suillus hirtellus]
MAQTKQTSKKMMGGPVKCSTLLQLKKLASHAGMEVIKTVQSKALPSSGKVMLRPLLHNIVSGSNIMRPYYGFEDHDGTLVLTVPATIHGHIKMPSQSQISSNPILVLHFILTSLDPLRSPVAIMQHKLWPYRPKNPLQFHKIIFNIGTDEKAKRHIKSMEILIGHLKLQEYKHIKTFIYTHSEIERGYIWGGFEDDKFVGRRRTKVTIQGKPVTYAIDVFFAGLFFGGIEEYVRGTTLWVLICGHMVRQPDSFKLLQTCVKKYEVEHVFAFDAVLFHMCLTIPFIIIYVCHVLIEGFEIQEVMLNLLQACPHLAMHLSIIHIR